MGDGIKPTVYSHFTLGDMAAYYMLEKEDNQIELLLIPVQKEKKLTENFDALFDSKRLHGDSLIQVKLLDDMYPGACETVGQSTNAVLKSRYIKSKAQKKL